MYYQRFKRFSLLTLEVLRLDDPRPALYLFMPCVWGIMLAKGDSNAKILPKLIIFAVTCILMYCAGCVINDVVDRDIDAMIPRTKNRAIASGRYSVLLALFIALVLSCISFAIILLLNKTSIMLCIITGVMIVVYPFTKRITHMTQRFLGLTANMGILIGYASMTNSITISGLVAWIGASYWTCIYDTIYACQDRESDIQFGVKSMAVLYGDKIQIYLKGYAVMMFLCLFAAGLLDPIKMQIGYYVFLAFSAVLLLKSISEADFTSIDGYDKKVPETKAGENVIHGINATFIGPIITIAFIMGRYKI